MIMFKSIRETHLKGKKIVHPLRKKKSNTCRASEKSPEQCSLQASLKKRETCFWFFCWNQIMRKAWRCLGAQNLGPKVGLLRNKLKHISVPQKFVVSNESNDTVAVALGG
jgi:hypothetical protein